MDSYTGRKVSLYLVSNLVTPFAVIVLFTILMGRWSEQINKKITTQLDSSSMAGIVLTGITITFYVLIMDIAAVIMVKTSHEYMGTKIDDSSFNLYVTYFTLLFDGLAILISFITTFITICLVKIQCPSLYLLHFPLWLILGCEKAKELFQNNKYIKNERQMWLVFRTLYLSLFCVSSHLGYILAAWLTEPERTSSIALVVLAIVFFFFVMYRAIYDIILSLTLSSLKSFCYDVSQCFKALVSVISFSILLVLNVIGHCCCRRESSPSSHKDQETGLRPPESSKGTPSSLNDREEKENESHSEDSSSVSDKKEIAPPATDKDKGLPAITAKEPSAIHKAKEPSAIHKAKEPSAIEAKEPSAIGKAKEPSAIEAKEPSAIEAKEPSAIEAKEPSATKKAKEDVINIPALFAAWFAGIFFVITLGIFMAAFIFLPIPVIELASYLESIIQVVLVLFAAMLSYRLLSFKESDTVRFMRNFRDNCPSNAQNVEDGETNGKQKGTFDKNATKQGAGDEYEETGKVVGKVFHAVFKKCSD